MTDVVSATIDNAPNIQNACRIELLSRLKNVINCYVHPLQLAVKDGLSTSIRAQEILRISNEVAAFFHRSSVAHRTLMEECKAESVPSLHTEIRWNSQYDSCKSVSRNKDAIVLTYSKLDEDDPLTSDVVKDLDHLQKYLINSNLLSIFNDSPPRLIRKTLEDVKKNAEVEYRKRVQTEMTQYIKLTGPKQGKSSHPSPKDIGTETLNFWRSLHPTAPTADDRASAGKFWGKPCDQWPSLWLHALIAQEALTVMSSSAPTVCKVVSFVVDRPKKVNGVMIGDGEIMLRLKWLNGPAVFMARNAKKYPEQNYKLDDFNNQFSISKREPREP